MDIRHWGFGKIMQLPDWCFGSRWLVVTTHKIAAAATRQWMVKRPVPDRIVLWGYAVVGRFSGYEGNWYKIAIGDHEPADDAGFDQFRRLFEGDLDNNAEEGGMFGTTETNIFLPCREPLDMQGERFIIQARNAHSSVNLSVTFSFLISSVPTEVPDWLTLDMAKVLKECLTIRT